MTISSHFIFFFWIWLNFCLKKASRIQISRIPSRRTCFHFAMAINSSKVRHCQKKHAYTPRALIQMVINVCSYNENISKSKRT